MPRMAAIIRKGGAAPNAEPSAPAMMGTAYGNIVAQLVTLTSVRLGEVEVFNVNAVVTPMAMPYVLLGNSFLTRFQMRRDNDVMRLEVRR